MRNQKTFFSILLAGGLLLLLAAAWFLTHTHPGGARPLLPIPAITSPSTPLPPKQTNTSQTTSAPAAPSDLRTGSYPEIQRVYLEQAKAAFDDRSAVFLDVRGAEFYAFSHIPGAVNIPLADLSTRLNELDPDQWIIPYCT